MNEMISNKKHPKKVLTPFDRLNRRILKGFEKKKFIGDIIINDVEYEILIDYFKTKCYQIINYGLKLKADPVFATALVQIGMKHYDRNFWSHVSDLLEKTRFNVNYHGIRRRFTRKLKTYGTV